MTDKKILVVEDSGIVAQDIQTRLQKLGYVVSSTARSGLDAIQEVSKERPDLVLMDIKLRGDMDGVEAAGIIRESFGVPVVYLTAYADEKTLERAKITEPFGYIVKPFDENALLTNIEIGLFKHRMEQRLRESERWLATTLSCIGDATVATDQEGRIRLMNPRAELLTGRTQDEAFGRHWSDIVEVVSEDTGRPMTINASDLDRGALEPTRDPLVLVDKEGSEIPIELNAAPIVDDGGFVSGIVLVFRDISEQRVSRQSLERSHNLLHLVLEGVSDVIFLKNLEGHYILMNKAGSQLLGASEDDIVGKVDSELFGPGTAHLMSKSHERAVKSGKAQTFECIVTRDGDERTLLFTKGVCRNNAGTPVGIAGIGRDITELKIERRPLHQRKKLAKTGRAVGTLAHEMDQSLTGIRESFTAIKDQAPEKHGYERHVQEIEGELSHIAGIAQQMSDLYWHSRSRHAPE